MRVLRRGEKYERKASVRGNSVAFQHSTLNKASGKVYVLSTTFDFTGVSPLTLLRLAGENRLIAWRTAFKNAETVDDSADGQTVNVLKWLSKQRAPKMRTGEAITKLAGILSKEQLQAKIAELEAMMAVRD